MSISSWPIRRLLPAIAVVILLGCALAGAGAYWQASRATAAENDLNAHIAAKARLDRFAFLDDRTKFNNLVVKTLPQAAAKAQQDLATDMAEMQKIITALKAAPLTPAEHQAADTVAVRFGAYVAWNTKMAKDTRPISQLTAEDFAKISKEYGDLTNAQTTATAQAQKLFDASVARAQADVRSAVKGFLTLVLVASVVAGILFTGGVLIFGRQLTRRMALLGSALRKVADGDLTVRADAGGADEISAMAADVNHVVERYATVFSSIGDTSSRLGGASHSLQDVAARVGRSAEETSARAEVVARSADEVSQNVQAVAAGSEEMGSSISEIAQNAHEAARVATGAVQAVESTTGTMNKLGDSSREIGDVVRLITSIAEQTNLLALNATIEAARAGDAGKGFAVVADEVKQLAQETARATEDISRRVEAIQEDADQAARAIADIAGVITRINEFQTTIASAVEEQTATTQTINHGVSDAASGSGQIASNISAVADAAGETASSITEANTSARELAAMSEELTRLVGSFRF